MNERIRSACKRYAINIALSGLFFALTLTAAACNSSAPAKGTSVTLSNGETAGVIVTINTDESSSESSTQTAPSESVSVTAGTGDDVIAAPTSPKPGNSYSFRYQNILILPGEDAAEVVAKLTENCEITDTFEQDKKGQDVIVRSYTFSSFVLYARANSEGKYIITRIVLSGRDSVTPEGIGIGATHDDVIKVYGSQYTDNGNSVTYTSGSTDLTFFFANGTVSDITYKYNRLS
jgi:hypothetical protein